MPVKCEETKGGDLGFKKSLKAFLDLDLQNRPWNSLE